MLIKEQYKRIYVTEYFSSTFKLLFTLMNIEYQIIPLKMFLLNEIA